MSDYSKQWPIDAAQVDRDLFETIQAARLRGLLDLDAGKNICDRQIPLQTEPKTWIAPSVDPRVFDLVEKFPSRPRNPCEIETEDTGRATSRADLRDCASFVQGNLSANVWHEFARFVAPRGKIGICRLVWTWLDLLGSPDAGLTFYSPLGNALVIAPINVKAAVGYSATLPGTAAQQYTPLRLIVTLIATNPPLNGNCKIRLGTSIGGAEIMTDTPLIGLTQLNGNYSIDLGGALPPIAGDAAIHLTVTTADTGAGTGTASATLYGVLAGQQALIPVSSGSPCGIDPLGPVRQGITTIRWSLRLEQLAGRSIDPWGVPQGGAGGDPPGYPFPGWRDWNDARHAWGTSGGLTFIVVPSDHLLRLCAYVPANVAQYVAWIGGRLQGYIQPEGSPVSVQNVRHGWNW